MAEERAERPDAERRPVSEELAHLAEIAWKLSLRRLQDGRTLETFVVREDRSGERAEFRPFAEDLDAAWEACERYIAELPEDAERYALAYDGVLRDERGRERDAILVEVSEAPFERRFVFGWRYRPLGRIRPAEYVGEPRYLGTSD